MSLNHNDDYNIEIRTWIEKNLEYAKYLSTQKLSMRNCPLCGSSDYSHFTNNGQLDYSQCKKCDLIFMNPTMDDSTIQDGFKGDDELLMSYFNIMKKYKKYELTKDLKPDPLQDNKLKDIFIYKKNGTLLDLGCSVGDFLHKAKHFYNVEGLEINPITSQYAKKHFTVYTDFLHNLSLQNSYDIVTLHQILYGVPDTVSLLKDIHKILNHDGILYINTPNASSYAMNIYKGKTNHLYGYTALNVFNKSSLKKLAELSGFTVDFFRTEWLDIYKLDLIEFYQNPEKFIHKRNTHIQGYSQSLQREDQLDAMMNQDLKDAGNYIVAILKKI